MPTNEPGRKGFILLWGDQRSAFKPLARMTADQAPAADLPPGEYEPKDQPPTQRQTGLSARTGTLVPSPDGDHGACLRVAPPRGWRVAMAELVGGS